MAANETNAIIAKVKSGQMSNQADGSVLCWRIGSTSLGGRLRCDRKIGGKRHINSTLN